MILSVIARIVSGKSPQPIRRPLEDHSVSAEGRITKVKNVGLITGGHFDQDDALKKTHQLQAEQSAVLLFDSKHVQGGLQSVQIIVFNISTKIYVIYVMLYGW